MYEQTASQLIKILPFILKSKWVPFIKGNPAIGKSAVVKAMAKKFNLKVIDYRLSTAEPTDLMGMPDVSGDVAVYKPFVSFPIKGTKIPEGYSGWLIFLDELNAADKAVQAASYKLLLDRMIGDYDLDDNVYIMAAGNLTTDRAITNKLGTASQSRLIHLTMKYSYEDFMDFIAEEKWDERIYAYLSWKPGSAFDFKPDHQNDTFCAPRTWEMAQDLLAEWGPDEIEGWFTPAIVGCMSPLIAEEFVTFSKVFLQLPDLKDIIDRPMEMGIPTTAELKFATVVSLAGRTDEDNVDQIMRYVERITGMEFKTTYMRMAIAKCPNIRHAPAIQRNMIALIRK